METLTTIISFVLLAGLIISPILIIVGLSKQNIKYKFIVFLILAITITSFITLIFGWWTNTSNQILLSSYGYDFEATNDAERFANVAAENMDRVKRLEISRMGIGWPLKSFMTYVIYLPYIMIIYSITYLIEKYKKDYTLNKVQKRAAVNFKQK